MSGAPTSVAQIIIWKWGKRVFLFFLFSKRQLHAGKLQRNKNSYKFVLPFTEKHSGLNQNRRIGGRPWCTAEKKDKVHTESVMCVLRNTHITGPKWYLQNTGLSANLLGRVAAEKKKATERKRLRWLKVHRYWRTGGYRFDVWVTNNNFCEKYSQLKVLQECLTPSIKHDWEMSWFRRL